ncbi:Serine/threonine-protein kinase TOR, partial [Tetrabaena socialis]
MRNFSVELLKESPSPALRACFGLAQVHPTMARELFAAGFVSCWAELDAPLQEQLVRSLEAALASPTIPPETVTSLLNLAEFMEHDDKRLPLDTRTLGALAEKQYVPELLPKFVAVFGEAERAGSWDLVRPALGALEALGGAVDDSLHLLLSSMVRLISPAASSTPPEIRRAALRSMRKLIPRMQLGGYASAVLHPLIKVLDGQSDEQLRRDALDTMCAVAVCLGPDFAIFVPTIRKLLRYNPMAITQPGVAGYGAGSGAPHVMLAFLKHLWTQGQRGEAYSRIKDLVRELQANAVPPAAAAAAATAAAAAATANAAANLAAPPTPPGPPQQPAGGRGASAFVAAPGSSGALTPQQGGGPRWLDRPQASLNGRAFLRLGIWQWAMN